MEQALSEIIPDANILPFAVLFLLMSGKHDEDLIDSPKRKSLPLISDKKAKKKKLQTYIRATTSDEYIEVERIEDEGQKSYKVEARLEPLIMTEPILEQVTMRNASVHLEFNDFTVQGVGTFKVTGKSGTGKETSAPTEINFDTPENVKLTTNYKLNGKIYEKPAKGEGNIEINIIGASLFGMIDVTDNGSELQIQDLTLSYNYKSLQVSYTGLKVEGMKSVEVDKHVNEMVILQSKVI
ncbi:uncharacterized protein LOC135839986 isoform X2 [Planococcus citri]|uniref:uncharacterized protein LOC135839986 isoform X2 n=1 Tax=Planococcus citri TaxID=170843 RepID=UPI0031FA22EA